MTSRHPRAMKAHRERAAGGPRRAERRDALLGAALAVIRRDGPNASMDAMAAEAGITKPILYRWFGDRDGLLLAVAERFADELVRRISAALEGGGEAQERLEQAIDGYIGFIEDDPGLYAFLTQRATAASPVLLGVVDRVAAPIARAIGEELRAAGADSGPAESWAYGIVGMVHMAGARWVASPTLPRKQLVRYLAALVWDGMPGYAAGH